MSEAASGAPTPSRLVVKVYSGGQVVQTYEADRFTSHKGDAWVTLPTGRRHIVGRNCSMRSSGGKPPKEASHEAFYEASLYSGGKVVETVKAFHYTEYEGNVYLTDIFGELVIFAGTYVIRRIGGYLNAPSQRSNHKVTAYSGGTAIGTWYAHHVTTGQNMLYLQGDHFWDVIVGGTFVSEAYP